MTLGILQLSFRTVFGRDVDETAAQSATLSVLQFVAKSHEICIVISLSEIILHRIRFELNGEGIPFGLLASGYSVSSITFLWTWQFWARIFNSDLRQTYSSRLSLFILIMLATLLAAVAGPSSAIAVVPRLDWWDTRSSVTDRTTTYFTKSSELWPEKLTADVFRSVDCISSKGARTDYCPSAGWSTIAEWDNNDNFGRPFNIAMPIANTNMIRYLAASSDGRFWTQLPPPPHRNPDRGVIIRTGYSIASSVSELLARHIGCLYEWYDNNDPIENINRAIFTISRTK